MATAATEKPLNGKYGMYNGAAEVYHPAPTDVAPANAAYGEQPTNGLSSSNPGGSEDEKPSKEMIGWYFVEQYYNTMSKEPTKLYLYYTKKSQLVAGDEAEKVSVAVGQKNIGERIKELDIQNCKVRVTNVDTQASGQSILVQVIGEMSNKAAPHRKFTQTFVLAEQPTGYFVLNDIFRYIVEEDEEGDEEEQAQIGNGLTDQDATPAHGTAETPLATLTSSDDPVQQQHDANKLNQKLQHEVRKPSTFQSGGVQSDSKTIPQNEPPAPPVAARPMEEADADEVEPTEGRTIASSDNVDPPEKPRDPEPTPVASTPKPEQSTPVANTPKPSAPKTWANLVASKGALAPPASVTDPKTTSAANNTAPKPKGQILTSRDSNASITPNTEETQASQQPNGNNGWQTAGAENKQKQGRLHSASVSGDQDKVLAYVKNVTDKVDGAILKSTLESFGKLVYFDISRMKNCAFVEFADVASYQAAVSANPHVIGDENVLVEERRPRANAYGGNASNRGGMRGGRYPPGDRPGSGGRGSFSKDGGRGGYIPRGRGGLSTRGRNGQPQAA